MKKLLLTLVCVLSAGLWAENYAVRFCGQNGGENTKVCAGARVGTEPDGSEEWGVATCGPDITIAPGAVVPAGAMIYESVGGMSHDN